jgi:segregation and condensation protein A
MAQRVTRSATTTARLATLRSVQTHDLDLDLDVFAGPFDLLLAVVLREEVNLLDVPLGAIAAAYVERLGEREELDLESATEFLVLIAALLELKSRLMLPRESDEDGLAELAPEEAAEELLARMLEYRRYRDAAAMLVKRFERNRDYGYRSAPLPASIRRAKLDAAVKVYEPDRLAGAIGSLLSAPPAPDTSHIRVTVSLEKRLGVLKDLLSNRDVVDFDEMFGREDRLTQAVTIFALLELYKKGEASWTQDTAFGPIEIRAGRPQPQTREMAGAR